MPQYFFILGREPQLSVTEAWQVAKAAGYNFTNLTLTKDFWVVASETLALPQLQQTLAGMVKLGEIVATVKPDSSELKQVVKKLIQPANRLYFGFSWYGQTPAWLKTLGLDLKREFKSAGRVRFVVSRDQVLSSVTVKKNHLLPPDGYELVWLPVAEQVYVGRTMTVQPFVDYSQRDYGRPSREARLGMLPPKLARLMVNLAGGSQINSLLDPFCGTGTVLQEAALLGVKEITGSDKSEEQINRATTNWQWLTTKRPSVTANLELWPEGLEELAKNLGSHKFSAIVTEPDLGPPLTGKEPASKLEAIVGSLNQDYSRWLNYLSRLLAQQGLLVMVWPALVRGDRFNFLSLTQALSSAGLKFADAIPRFVPKSWLSQRGTLLYYRPGQKVAREIVVLEKK